MFSFERSSSREKINVWAGLCGNGTIIGPFFFYVNINSQTYLNVINEEIVPRMQMHFQFDVLGDVMFPDLWWFQDGAGCHPHAGFTARLSALCGANVVALRRQVEWPARSPDPTPCDFFLWGYLKSRVYKSPPRKYLYSASADYQRV